MKYSYAEKKEILDFVNNHHSRLTVEEMMRQKKISKRMVMNVKIELGLVKRRPNKAKVAVIHSDTFNVHVLKNWLVGAE